MIVVRFDGVGNLKKHRMQPWGLSLGASEEEQHLCTWRRMDLEVLHGRGIGITVGGVGRKGFLAEAACEMVKISGIACFAFTPFLNLPLLSQDGRILYKKVTHVSRKLRPQMERNWLI